MAGILGALRDVATVEALREHYLGRDGDWAGMIVARLGADEEQPSDLRRVEDAAHGLRWLELASGRRLDLGRSLVPQRPLALLDEVADARHADGDRR